MKTSVLLDTELTFMQSTQCLFVGTESASKEIIGRSIMFFVQISSVISHICQNITTVDRFILIIPSHCLESLLEDKMHNFPQVHQVNVYYDNALDLERDKARFQQHHHKLRFYHRRSLRMLLSRFNIDTVMHRFPSNYRATRNDVISACQERVSLKRPLDGDRSSAKSQRFDRTHPTESFHFSMNVSPTPDDGLFLWTISNVRKHIGTCNCVCSYIASFHPLSLRLYLLN